METISRQEAKERGLLYYVTGRPCRRGHLDGRFVSSNTCVICKAEHAKLETTKARESRQRATRYAADDGMKADARARAKAWALANPEKYAAYQKAWREANKEKRAADRKEWARKNPEREAELNRLKDLRRKARIRGIPRDFTADDLRLLRERSKGRCANCRKRRKLEVDHIMPIAKRGSNELRNLQMLCGPCNRRKHAKDPLVWAAENGRLV